SGYQRRGKQESERPSGWGSRESSTKGHASPDGWGNAQGAWGAPWGNASPAGGTSGTGGGTGGGWGKSASPSGGGGWGNSGAATSGWGKSPSPAGWGDSSTTTTGWGNTESSQRTSSQFGGKSPARLPPTSPRGSRTASPGRASTSSSADRGRERERRDQDRDRESRRESGSPSHHRSRRSPEKSSSHSYTSRDKERERDHSPGKRRESSDTAKRGDAMDVDPPLPPLAAPAFEKSAAEPRANNQTPASATSSMPPPPLPLGAVSQPLGAAATPLGKAPPPPVGRPPSLPPPPHAPASTPAPNTPTTAAPATATPAPATAAPATRVIIHTRPTSAVVTPVTTTATGSTTPRPPASPAVSTMQPPPVPRPPAPVPVPASASAMQQPASPATSVKDVPSVAQAQEWVSLLDTLLEHRRKSEHLQRKIKNLEGAERHRTIPNSSRRIEGDLDTMLASSRTELNQLQESVQSLSERFAVSMKVMQVSAPPTSTTGTGKSTLLVTSSVPALPGLGPEWMSQMLTLENNVSKMESELKLIEAEMASVVDNAKEVAKSKEEVRTVKEGLRRESENRAKEVGEVKKEAMTAKDMVGEMKRELEGMKMDVGNAYRGLGETKQDVSKLKTQQDTLRTSVERVELALTQGRGGSSAQVEQLRQEVVQLKTMAEELRQEIERLKGGTEERAKSGKREREVSAPSGDAMDVDEVRPIKRVRLSVASAPLEEGELLAAAPTLDAGGPSNERLKELIDQVQEYVYTLESEMVQHHTDTREQLEEFAERIGWEPVVYSGDPNAEPVASTSGAGRSESAPPAASSPKAASTSKARSSAPPEISSEGTTIAKPKLATVQEDTAVVTGSREANTIAAVRQDLDNVMEQLLGLWAAKGLWPEIIGKNLAAASGTESLEQVWDKVAGATKITPAVNGMKQVNGTGTHKPVGQTDDVMALVKNMQAEQAKMAQRMAEMEAKSARVEAEKETMRVKLAEQDKELKECLFTISSQRSSSRQRVPVAPTSEVTSISYTSDSNSRTTTRTPTRSTKDGTQSERERDSRAMAQPSSSHRERDRDREHRSDRERRERTERSHHHHHRTISSTTLLLVLSLILAILAVMLSLPSTSSRSSAPPVVPPGGHSTGHASAGPGPNAEPLGPGPGAPGPQPPLGTEHLIAIPEPTGIWAHLTPKRNRELINRESLVAFRESEVAKREAELLAGSPGGLTLSCPPAPVSTIIDAYTFTVTHTVAPVMPAAMAIETQTVVKEVIREVESPEPPPWYRPANPRFDDVLERESIVAEREREIAMREDIVGRRENDAGRRENWIMEQLLHLQNEPGPVPNMDEEYVYEVPPLRRKIKDEVVEAPPPIISHIYETETETETIHHISTSIIHETTTSIINNVLTSVATSTRTAISIQTVVSTATLTSTFIPPIKTVTVPMPAGTRAAPPAPERPKGSPTGPRGPGRTNVVEMVTEEETFIPVEVEETETIVEAPLPPPPRETIPPPPPPVRETVTVVHDRDYGRERYEQRERYDREPEVPPQPQRVRKPRGQERPQPTRPQRAQQPPQKEAKGWFGRGPW
ncbi:hypothetical protein FRC07_002787, partial [Ceratobasidium sp. 392]